VLVTVTFSITLDQQASLARIHGCERYEVGTVLLDPFIRQAVQDAFTRVDAVKKPRVVAPAATMIIRRKRPT
jgi:hypothetical protein